MPTPNLTLAFALSSHDDDDADAAVVEFDVDADSDNEVELLLLLSFLSDWAVISKGTNLSYYQTIVPIRFGEGLNLVRTSTKAGYFVEAA